MFKAGSFVRNFRMSLLTNIVVDSVVYKNYKIKVSMKTIINKFMLTDFHKNKLIKLSKKIHTAPNLTA